MFQTAVFVDAGYLYAQGSALLIGSKQPRERLALAPRAALTALTARRQAAARNG